MSTMSINSFPQTQKVQGATPPHKLHGFKTNVQRQVLTKQEECLLIVSEGKFPPVQKWRGKVATASARLLNNLNELDFAM